MSYWKNNPGDPRYWRRRADAAYLRARLCTGFIVIAMIGVVATSSVFLAAAGVLAAFLAIHFEQVGSRAHHLDLDSALSFDRARRAVERPDIATLMRDD